MVEADRLDAWLGQLFGKLRVGFGDEVNEALLVAADQLFERGEVFRAGLVRLLAEGVLTLDDVGGTPNSRADHSDDLPARWLTVDTRRFLGLRPVLAPLATSAFEADGTRLDFKDTGLDLGPEFWEALAEFRPRSLNISSVFSTIGPRQLRTLLAQPSIRGATEFVLDRAYLTTEAARALAEAPWFADLERLEITDVMLGDGVAGLLFQPTRSLRCRTLTLRAIPAHPEGVAALIPCLIGSNLEALDLAGHQLDSGLFHGLFDALETTPICWLDLSSSDMTPGTAMTLASSGFLDQLHSLALDYNGISDEGLDALATRFGRSTALPLRRFSLNHGGISSRGLIRLADAGLEHLSTLSLNHNQLSPEGTRVLAEWLSDRHLDAFDVSRNEIGTQGCQTLIRSGLAFRVRRLDLSGNQIEPEALIDLDDSTDETHLEHLDLSRNPIGLEGAIALARSAGLRSLTVLRLQGCQIGDDGLAAIARSEHLIGLQELQLNENLITDEGVITLAESDLWEHLVEVSLVANPIGIEGVRALLRNPHLDARCRRLGLDDLNLDAGPNPQGRRSWNAALAKVGVYV